MTLRKSLLCLSLIFLVFTGSASAADPADDSNWESIAPGVDFRKFQLPDPNNVFVARMERNNPAVTLESSIANGILAEGKETVSGMSARYDQALNFWGGTGDPPNWGMRNQVVVAINGSYFDIGSGIPQGGMVQSGWYAKRYDDLGGWGGFAWKLDRSAFISECLFHQPEKQVVTYPATGEIQRIDGINKPPPGSGLTIYTPQYNSRTGTDNSGTEVLVELKDPAMVFPAPAYISGIVRAINNDFGNNLIPFNSIVISARVDGAHTLLKNIKIGSEVRISQEITSYEPDCSTRYSLSWTKTYSSIQGAFFFLKGGQIQEYNDAGANRRNPRTAIVFNDQYIYFVVVDGRDPYYSIGMTISELAQFARDALGATWGVAMDGGGSSTMVINGKVVNNTYCNIYTCNGYHATYIPPASSYTNDDQFGFLPGLSVISTPAGIERVVANGMMMVIVQPGEYSSSFGPGDPVVPSSDIDIRLGPGTNYASFITVPVGTYGKIIDQINGLQGVLAKSTHWWYVDFGGVLGWVPEEALNYSGDQNRYAGPEDFNPRRFFFMANSLVLPFKHSK